MRSNAITWIMRLACAMPLAPGFASGKDAAPLPEPRQGTSLGMRYLVFETGGAKPYETLPMIVGLHYAGAEPQVMLEYFDTSGVKARVILPRAPYARSEGSAWFPKEYARLDPDAQDAVAFDVANSVADFLAEVRTRHPTRGRPVVVGVSYGGDVGFLLALRHPDAIAAAFPVAARLPPSWIPAINACKPHCPPIRALHGEQDTTAPIAPTRAAVERLARQGYDARLAGYAGVAHDFDAAMERDFAAQVRAWVERGH